MPKKFVLAVMFMITFMLGPTANAEVTRCADAAGNASYTDGPCPAGARAVGRVTVPPPAAAADNAADAQRQRDNADAIRARPSQNESASSAARSAQTPAGPAIIDSRRAGSNASGAGAAPPPDSRWSDRVDDPAVADYGYDDPGAYPGGYRPPRPPRDQRPRLRNCNAAGCRDAMGNHYDRAGQIDRYQGIDGKSCRPVGTTTICR